MLLEGWFFLPAIYPKRWGKHTCFWYKTQVCWERSLGCSSIKMTTIRFLENNHLQNDHKVIKVTDPKHTFCIITNQEYLWDQNKAEVYVNSGLKCDQRGVCLQEPLPCFTPFSSILFHSIYFNLYSPSTISQSLLSLFTTLFNWMYSQTLIQTPRGP